MNYPIYFNEEKNMKQIARLIVTFHDNYANHAAKVTVSHFMKQEISRRTIYDILEKYEEHGITNFLPKSERPSKIIDKQTQALIKDVNRSKDQSIYTLTAIY